MPRHSRRTTTIRAGSLLRSSLALAVLAGTSLVVGQSTRVDATPTSGGVVSGTVFRDYDGGGTTTAGEPGEPGIEVTAVCVSDTGSDGVLGTRDDVEGAPVGPATTDAAGSYSLTVNGSPCRVELSIPATKSYLKAGMGGASALQFVNAGATANFPVWNPGDYCQANARLYVSCFAKGDQTAEKGVMSFANTAPTAAYPIAGGTGAPDVTTLATSGTVGAVYGNAVRYDGQEYLGTFVKRHTNYGSAGATNTIYRFDTSTQTVSTLITLPGTLTAHDSVTDAYLSDDAIYNRVGREGLGDIDISEDQNTLYVVNMSNSTLVSVPLVGSGASTTVGSTSSVSIPAPTGCDGPHPMGLGVRDGLVYVGGVCGADSTATGALPQGDPTKLLGYIYTFNGAAFSAAPILTFRLDYPRGCAWSGGFCLFDSSVSTVMAARWEAWNGRTPTLATYNFASNPQPMLSNIDILDGGRLAISLRDRYGDMQGNVTETPGTTTAARALSAGDLLMACPNTGGTLTLESAGKCGTGTQYAVDSTGQTGNRVGVVVASGPDAGKLQAALSGQRQDSTANEGPGGAKVYAADGVPNGFGSTPPILMNHDDSLTGSSAILRRTGDLIATTYDQSAFFQQGVTRYSSTQSQTGGLTLLNTSFSTSTLFGKANGLGDLALLCDRAPFEIGNRVWKDLNGDGLQGPSEPGIAGITVRLYASDGTTLRGTAITDSSGTYRFDSSNNEAAAGNGDAVGGGLSVDTSYVIKIDNSTDFSNAAKLKGSQLSPSVSGSNTAIDSNAVLGGGTVYGTNRFPEMSVAGHGPGQNDQSFDVGFVPLATVTITKVLSPVSDGGRFDLIAGAATVATSAGHGGSGSSTLAPLVPHTISELASGGTTLASYSSSLSCRDDSTLAAVVVSSNAGTTGSITPLPGQAITCTFTNTRLVPQLTLSKSVAESSFSAVGDVLHYTITVTNSGTAALSSVSVSDPGASGLSCSPGLPIGSLAAGGVVSCTASHTVVAADLAGSYSNTATVSGTSPDGVTVSASGVVSSPVAKLVLSKSVAESSFSAVGDVLHYTITVTNSGTAALSSVSVSDPGASGLSCSPGLPIGSLAAGGVVSCTASHTVVAADLAGSYSNTATVSGTSPDGVTVSASGVVSSPVAKLVLSKSVAESSFSAVGDVLHYTITVTNSGTAALSSVSVSDPGASGLSCSPGLPIGSLAAGGVVSCTASHTVGQADLDAARVDNVATADWIELGGSTQHAVSNTVTANALVSPAMTVDKSASDLTYAAIGTVLYYTIVARNTGNVSLRNVSVADPTGTITACLPALPVATLAPADEVLCSATHNVVQADLDRGYYTNVAAGTAFVPSGAVLSVSSSAVTVPASQRPHLAVTKATTTTVVQSVGDVIDYTVVAQNDGNVALTAVTVNDPGADSLSCSPAVPVANLSVGSSISCAATHTVTQSDLDAGTYSNVAWASGTASGSGAFGGGLPATTSATSNAAVVSALQNPRLTLGKSTTAIAYHFVGERVPYLLLVTNVGNVTLGGIVVTDANAQLESCSPTLPGSLAPGGQLRCDAIHVVTQADLDGGALENTATAATADHNVSVVSQTVTLQVVRASALTVRKSSSSQPYTAVGSPLDYQIVIQNTGNVTLSDVSLDDPGAVISACSPKLPATQLGSGESVTCLATRRVTQGDLDVGAVLNVASASATDPAGLRLQVSSQPVLTSAIQEPRLVLAKTAALHDGNGDGVGEVGEVIDYLLTASNLGNTTVSHVAIADPMFGALDCDRQQPTTLAPGETFQCRGSHTIAAADVVGGRVLNTATASGEAACGANDVCSTTVANHAEANIVATPPSLPKTGTDAGLLLRYALELTLVGLVLLVAPARRRQAC